MVQDQRSKFEVRRKTVPFFVKTEMKFGKAVPFQKQALIGNCK